MKIKVLEIILMGISAFALIITLFAIPIDIVSFYSDKETYIKVYHLNAQNENLEWDYFKGWIYQAIISVVGLFVIYLRVIKKDNEVIEKINWAFLLFFFISVLINFLLWMQTGFDH